MRKFSEKDKKTVAAQISFYKEHRKLLQFGNFYRLGDSFGGDYGGFISVSPDRGAAIAVIAAEKRTNVPPPRVAFKGLNPAYVYEVTARRQENYENNLSFTAGGDVLMCGELFSPTFTTMRPRAKIRVVCTPVCSSSKSKKVHKKGDGSTVAFFNVSGFSYSALCPRGSL